MDNVRKDKKDLLRLHDCTIHEGGFRNNWKFDSDTERHIAFVNELAFIGSDIVDVGVLGNKNKNYGTGYFSSFCKAPDFEKVVNVEYALTLPDFQKIRNQTIQKVKNIDYIRLVVTQDVSQDALNEYCLRLKSYGYKILIHLECWQEKNIHTLLSFVGDLVNCNADMLVIDDVHSSYSAEQMIAILSDLNKKLPQKTGLGCRMRNAGNQAQYILEYMVHSLKGRSAAIETSVLGMSRNAALLELEIAAVYLNIHNKANYELTRINSVAAIIYKSVKNNISWKTDCVARMLCENQIAYDYREIAQSMQLTIKEMEHMFGKLAVCSRCISDQKQTDSSRCYEIINHYRQKQYRKKLAVVIWTDRDSEDLLEVYLKEQISNMAQSGLDIYFCCMIPKSRKSSVVMEYIRMGIHGIYWLENRKGMFASIQELLRKYKYIWMNQPEYIINFEYLNYHIMPLLNREYDFIFAENDWFASGKQGIHRECNAEDIFVNKLLQMYSLGTVIYAADFLNAVQKEMEGRSIRTEKDLMRGIFLHLENHKANGISYCGDVYLNENLNHIFNSDHYVDKWTTDLRKMIHELPSGYQKWKRTILDDSGSFYFPFSRHRICYLKLLKKTGKISRMWKYVHGSGRLLLLCPDWLCGFLMKCRKKTAGRLVEIVFRKMTYLHAKRKKIWNHTGTDYEKYVNCIVPQSRVAAKLICGNPDDIPDPWITIVIPTYKRADLLEDAINSVLRQEDIRHSWDIVVVDNEAVPEGESNDTERLIRRLHHPKILYYRNQKNIGISGNYNRGIELARGRWVSLLHSDDILVKGYLKRMCSQIELYSRKPGKKLGYISASYLSFYSDHLKNDRKWNIELKCRDEMLYQQQKKRSAALIRVKRSEFMLTGATGISLPSNGTVMNRKAVLEFGGFNDDLGICADMVLPLRMMKKYAVYRTDDVMGHYRVGMRHESSADNNAFKVEENYNDIREYYYRKVFGGKIMGLLFGQQHFFMVDRILGDAYWQDAAMHSLYPYEKQEIRDRFMLGRFGVINQFYRIQRKISILKGTILTKLIGKNAGENR